MQKVIYIVIIVFISKFNFAQTNGYTTANASVNLIMPLSIEAGSGDLDFGEIILTGSELSEKLNPKNGQEFIVKGQPNRIITLNFNSVELNNLLWISKNRGVAGTLKFIPEVIQNNNKRLRSGDNLRLTPNGLVGEAKLNVGGVVHIEANQPLGDYEGLFVITVSY